MPPPFYLLRNPRRGTGIPLARRGSDYSLQWHNRKRSHKSDQNALIKKI
jgi:hypothetical protein